MPRIVEGIKVIKMAEREIDVPYGTMMIQEPIREIGLTPSGVTTRGQRRVINAMIQNGVATDNIRLAKVRNELQEEGRKVLLAQQGVDVSIKQKEVKMP